MYPRVPKFVFIVIASALIACTTRASAQLQLGDNLSMRMNGSLGYGYSGTFSNYRQSAHGQSFGANANLDGSYFHPDFLNFNAHPYFNRGSASGELQSITRGTGFSSAVNLFGGSYFPGSATYGLDFSSNSEYYVAGIPNLVGDASSRNFSISWSELLPKYPHVYVTFSSDRSSATFGVEDIETKSRSKILTINSDYRLAGWDLRGNFNYNSSNFTTPDFLTREPLSLGGSGTTVGVQASHPIPHGGIGLGYSHSSYGDDQGGGGSGDNFTQGAGITLLHGRLSLSENFNYTTNTAAYLAQSVLAGSIPMFARTQDSSGMFVSTIANYRLGWGLSLNGYFNHREATFNDQEFSDSQYGGGISFNQQHRWFGFVTVSVGVVDTLNKQGNAGTGLVGSVAVNKKLGHWDSSADFSYYQSMQTLYDFTASSSYSFGGTVRRKLNPQTYWSASARGTKSGLTPIEGSSNHSETYTTSLSWKRYSVSGNYAQSDGVAVLNSLGGLVSTPVAGLVSDQTWLFNAKTWGANGSTRLYSRLYLSGGYTNIHSNTGMLRLGVVNDGDRYFFRAKYLLRRFEIDGGYTRLNQAVSTIPGGPRNTNSFYITLSRWFNVF